LRPGRFDLLLKVPPPDEEARLEIFKIHTHKNPLAKDISLQELVAETEGYTGADIEAVCREATMLAIRKFLNNTSEHGRRKQTKLEVTKQNFREAIKQMKERKNSAENDSGETFL
jgi:transitional endoplasmic reticulum ATPase